MSRRENDNWLHARRPARLAIAVTMSAPLAGMVIALVLALTVLNSGAPPEGSGAAGVIEAISGGGMVMATGFMLGALIGWPVMLAFGLPAHALLLRKTSAKIGWYALAGGAIGAAAGALRLIQTLSSVRPDAYLLYIAVGAVSGAMAAIVFWWLRRPDKDAAQAQS